MSATPYVETEYLVAVMEDDYEKAEALAKDMLPGEIRKLHQQLRTGATWLEAWGA